MKLKVKENLSFMGSVDIVTEDNTVIATMISLDQSERPNIEWKLANKLVSTIIMY